MGRGEVLDGVMVYWYQVMGLAAGGAWLQAEGMKKGMISPSSPDFFETALQTGLPPD